VILHQGYLGGTLLFERDLRRHGCRAELELAETATTVYSCARMTPASVFINGVKVWIEITSFPAGIEKQIIAKLSKAFPQFEPGTNTLETGLNNPNPSGHIPDYLFNLGLAYKDGVQGTFHFRELWIEPVQRVKARMESERLAVMSALGLRGMTRNEFVHRSYPAGSGARMTTGVPRFGPKLLPRYIWEDVPAGLVPLVALATTVGVDVPVSQLLIDVASVAFETDFVKKGRNLERLGIAGLDPAAIIALFAGEGPSEMGE
jgi:opine dehydrogenase